MADERLLSSSWMEDSVAARPGAIEVALTQDKLDAILSTITPENITEMVHGAPETFRTRGRTSMPVYALLRSLMAGVDAGAGAEYQNSLASLHDALLSAVRCLEGATVVPGT